MGKVIIKDLQTGGFSNFTDLNAFYESILDDAIAEEMWHYDQDEESAEREKEAILTRMMSKTDEEKARFLYEHYDYKVVTDPGPGLIAHWEEETGKKF